MAKLKLVSVCALNGTRLDTFPGNLGTIDFTARFIFSRKTLLVNRNLSSCICESDADCFLLFPLNDNGLCVNVYCVFTVHSRPLPSCYYSISWKQIHLQAGDRYEFQSGFFLLYS